MSKDKTNQKGITLIALIITIIVMLILVGVSVTVALNGGLFATANQAKEETATERDKEYQLSSGQIEVDGKVYASYQDYLKDKELVETPEEDLPTEWTQNGLTVKKGTKTLTVGEAIIYDETNGGTETVTKDVDWKVLGAKNGELLIVSSTFVDNLYLESATDYLNNVGIDKINEVCEQYAKGVGATGARSINVEDVNRITGYSPEITGDGKKYEENTINEYGNKISFTMTSDGKIAYSGTNDVDGVSQYSTFSVPEGTYVTSDNSIESLENNYYCYYPNTLTTTSDGTEIGVPVDSTAYASLFANTTNGSGSYWLATSYAKIGEFGEWGLRVVKDGQIQGQALDNSYIGMLGGKHYIRAVVSLGDDFVLN